MRIPKELMIRGKQWAVTYKWRLEDDADGLTDGANRVIYLRHGLGGEKLTTFLHELIHAIMYESGIHHTELSAAAEELICHNVAEEFTSQFIFRKRRRITKV